MLQDVGMRARTAKLNSYTKQSVMFTLHISSFFYTCFFFIPCLKNKTKQGFESDFFFFQTSMTAEAASTSQR